jgi:hypothetical protein
MFLVLAMLAALPSSADVLAAERSRVYEPHVDYTSDGRRYVEFAPTVETRKATCVAVAEDAADCTYEARARDMFEREFSPWEKRQMRLLRRQNCWVRSS